MKKITSVLMLSMAFVLASCGGGSTGLSVSESSSPTPSASSEPSASSSVTRQEDHSGEQTVHLYTKFAITNEQTALVAYVWAWSDEVDGTWALATHVVEDWEAESNRHYTCTISNPVGMKVMLAIFSADSGVDADHEPNANWDGCVELSGVATIQDWTTFVGADLY